MFIDITPVPKPRMTRRDTWSQRPAVGLYHAFCDELRLKFPYPLPEMLRVEFYLPVPASWSLKKQVQYHRQPHRQRPDIDNLCKAVMDALAKEDSYIYILHAEKYWTAEQAGINIKLPAQQEKHEHTRKF